LTCTFIEKYVKKLLGKNEIEDSLKRLDTLTQDEARMAIAEVLRVTHSVDNNVRVVLDNVRVVLDGARRVFSCYSNSPEREYYQMGKMQKTLCNGQHTT
jgi:hypothetical protein